MVRWTFQVLQLNLRTKFQGVPVSAVLHKLRGLRRLQSYRSPTCTPGQLNPKWFRRISVSRDGQRRKLELEEVVAVFHSVNSEDFVMRGDGVSTSLIVEAFGLDGVAVVFRSVNAGALRDGCQGHEWPAPVNSGELRDGLGCGFLSVNSGELRDGLGCGFLSVNSGELRDGCLGH